MRRAERTSRNQYSLHLKKSSNAQNIQIINRLSWMMTALHTATIKERLNRIHLCANACGCVALVTRNNTLSRGGANPRRISD